MRRHKGALGFAIFSLLLTACVAPPPKWDYTAFEQERPASVLVVPVINNSPEVGAEYFFLSTITVPLAERGYYVFPVNGAHALLAESGMADPGFVHEIPPVDLSRLFGADAILYVEIENWEATYLVIQTTVKVAFTYTLKSGKTGTVLWKSHQEMTYTPQTTGGDPIVTLVVMVVQAAVAKMAPNYIPLARQANWAVIAGVNKGGQATNASMIANPMLVGPYYPSTEQASDSAPASRRKRR